jgi:hypothetical protein
MNRRQEVQTQSKTELTLGLDQITNFIYRLDGSLGEVNLEKSNSRRYLNWIEGSHILVTFQKRSLWMCAPMAAALRVLVLVAAHPKLRSFV